MALYPDPDNNTTTGQSEPPSVYAAEMGSQSAARVPWPRKRRPPGEPISALSGCPERGKAAANGQLVCGYAEGAFDQ